MQRIKKVTALTPKDVNRMAIDKNNIEVLQQIAIKNQLSPNLYSPNSVYHKENKSILNHPFYQNLPNKQQENMPYLLKNASNLSPPNDAKTNGLSMQPVARERQKISAPHTQKHASNRYGDLYKNTRNEEESFQTISSVSLNNEISGATDVQVEDFFDPNHRKGKGCPN